MTHFYHPVMKDMHPNGINLPETNLDPMVWLNALPIHKPILRYSWYWQRFGCIPPLGEIGPFNSKEEALKDVKETFARELVVFGDGNGP